MATDDDDVIAASPYPHMTLKSFDGCPCDLTTTSTTAPTQRSVMSEDEYDFHQRQKRRRRLQPVWCEHRRVHEAFSAIEKNNMSKLRDLIEFRGVNVDSTITVICTMSLLEKACVDTCHPCPSERIEIVRYLLDKGASTSFPIAIKERYHYTTGEEEEEEEEDNRIFSHISEAEVSSDGYEEEEDNDDDDDDDDTSSSSSSTSTSTSIVSIVQNPPEFQPNDDDDDDDEEEDKEEKMGGDDNRRDDVFYRTPYDWITGQFTLEVQIVELLMQHNCFPPKRTYLNIMMATANNPNDPFRFDVVNLLATGQKYATDRSTLSLLSPTTTPTTIHRFDVSKPYRHRIRWNCLLARLCMHGDVEMIHWFYKYTSFFDIRHIRKALQRDQRMGITNREDGGCISLFPILADIHPHLATFEMCKILIPEDDIGPTLQQLYLRASYQNHSIFISPSNPSKTYSLVTTPPLPPDAIQVFTTLPETEVGENNDVTTTTTTTTAKRNVAVAPTYLAITPKTFLHLKTLARRADRTQQFHAFMLGRHPRAGRNTKINLLVDDIVGIVYDMLFHASCDFGL